MTTPENETTLEAAMADDLHRSVSRVAAGLILFNETGTKGDVRRIADLIATGAIAMVYNDLRRTLEGKRDYWRNQAVTAWRIEQTHFGAECNGRVLVYEEMLELLGGSNE